MPSTAHEAGLLSNLPRSTRHALDSPLHSWMLGAATLPEQRLAAQLDRQQSAAPQELVGATLLC